MGLRNAACIHIPPRVIWRNGQNAKKKKKSRLQSITLQTGQFNL